MIQRVSMIQSIRREPESFEGNMNTWNSSLGQIATTLKNRRVLRCPRQGSTSQVTKCDVYLEVVILPFEVVDGSGWVSGKVLNA